MPLLIISNNPQVIISCRRWKPVEIFGDVRDVFVCVRDYVHRGHVLLTHPLSGSLEPGKIPYKTVMVSGQPQRVPDAVSVKYIEAALSAAGRTAVRIQPDLTPDIKADYAAVDLSLTRSALDSLGFIRQS